MMTRKQSHTEAVKMLQQAAELIDQAHACANDARTADGIDSRLHRNSTTYVSLPRFSALAESIATAASDVKCDDCGLLMAACDCKWSNEEVKQ